MRKTIVGFIFIIALSFNVSAQTKEARKIDKLESYNCEEMMGRLDNFVIALNEEPNSKGFIIVYEGKYRRYINKKGISGIKTFLPRFGESNLRTRLMQNYLLNFRRFPKEKVLFIDGGFRKNHIVELWLIPNGANPPKPTPTLEKIKYRKGKSEDICAGLG